MKRLLAGIGKSAATTIVFFAVAEIVLRGVYVARNAVATYVPLPYALGDVYGPLPPWLERLQILEPDPALIWHAAGSATRAYVDIYSPIRSEADRIALLRRFLPWLPAEFRANPVWHVRLNRDGFRSPEFGPKQPGTVRVACVGDSWTFGMNVDQDRTYPAQLSALLARGGNGLRYEVLNFGVLGYSSFQGRRLLERRVLPTHPDIVVIGFAMNDSEIAGYRDRDMVDDGPPSWHERVRERLPSSEVVNLLRYYALALRFRPVSIPAYLRQQASDSGGADVDYGEMEPWTRVSPRDYEANVRAMIHEARGAGARVILLDNELWAGSPYRPVLVRIASDEHVPLVDSFALIAGERTRIERDLERRLALAPETVIDAPVSEASHATAGARVTVVFRVREGDGPPPHRLSIVGTDPALGSVVPNTIRMTDDGRGGDEKAGDGVWSYAARLARGARVYYMYTDGGAPGRWEGLDLPHVREFAVPVAGPDVVYGPVETFGRVYMQADNWHTDVRGYELIARAVAPLVAR